MIHTLGQIAITVDDVNHDRKNPIGKCSLLQASLNWQQAGGN
jgi:hypothetical protein